MCGRAKEVASSEKKNFNNFCTYLTELYQSAKKKRYSEIPEFTEIVEGIKSGTVSPSYLNEQYIEWLLAQNPYQPPV